MVFKSRKVSNIFVSFFIVTTDFIMDVVLQQETEGENSQKQMFNQYLKVAQTKNIELYLLISC